MVLVSASAPGTTGKAAPQPSYPAVFAVTFSTATKIATVRALFSDEAKVTMIGAASGSGGAGKLALTDPDSTSDVPSYAARFGGDFMLTSQGDDEQIYVHNARGPGQTLSALKLSGSVDDTAWASDRSGAIYTTDNHNDTIY